MSKNKKLLLNMNRCFDEPYLTRRHNCVTQSDLIFLTGTGTYSHTYTVNSHISRSTCVELSICKYKPIL